MNAGWVNEQFVLGDIRVHKINLYARKRIMAKEQRSVRET